MSSPNHPTSDIEDAFSSNSPNYTPASPDYSPASLRYTPSESSNNSNGLVPIASPTLLLFPDDPYMKVMLAYDAIIPPQVSILPQIIMPPSPMLSPIFNPQEFFILEELLPSKEQILILCCLVNVDRMVPKRTSTSVAPAMNQATSQQLIDNRVAAALKAQAANMANADNTNRNHEPREVPVVQKIEDEFYHLTVKGNDLKTDVRRFQELTTLCPTMMSNFEKMMEAFIGGLPQSIEGNVTASKPQTLEEAINIS
nr:reverse transcriptase domain-containing protein [Tanacetum cinerariifolium]